MEPKKNKLLYEKLEGEKEYTLEAAQTTHMAHFCHRCPPCAFMS
jgi:hypothetical protein